MLCHLPLPLHAPEAQHDVESGRAAHGQVQRRDAIPQSMARQMHQMAPGLRQVQSSLGTLGAILCCQRGEHVPPSSGHFVPPPPVLHPVLPSGTQSQFLNAPPQGSQGILYPQPPIEAEVHEDAAGSEQSQEQLMTLATSIRHSNRTKKGDPAATTTSAGTQVVEAADDLMPPPPPRPATGGSQLGFDTNRHLGSDHSATPFGAGGRSTSTLDDSTAPRAKKKLTYEGGESPASTPDDIVLEFTGPTNATKERRAQYGPSAITAKAAKTAPPVA